MSQQLSTAVWVAETVAMALTLTLDLSSVLVGARTQKYTAMVLSMANMLGCVCGGRPLSQCQRHFPEADNNTL